MTFGSLAQVRTETDRVDWTYAVFLAAAEEDLTTIGAPTLGGIGFAYRPGYQATSYPTRILWGPGGWDDLIAILDQFSDESLTDQVTFLDRTFYVRATKASGIELPRDRHDVLATEFDDDPATWHVLQADFPADAFVFVRDRDYVHVEVRRRSRVVELAGDRAAQAHAAKDGGGSMAT